MRKRIMVAGLLKAALWTALMTTSVRAAANEERFFENGNLSGQLELVDASHAWHVNDDGLKRLRSYVLRGEIDFYMQNKVRVLKLDGTRITDAGLKHLEGKDGLTALEEISLADTQIGDVGLQSLAALKHLRRANLGRSLVFQDGVSGTRVTAGGIMRLHAALPACRIEHERISLELSDQQREQFKLWSAVAEPRLNDRGDIVALLIRPSAKLTEVHRQSLPLLKHLVELYAAGVFSAEDVAVLPPLTSLRQLCLRECPLNDDAIGPLQTMTELQVLDLAGTKLSDHGLSPLRSLTKLTALDMRTTAVRTRGLQQLRESLPATEFVFDAWRVVELPYRWLTVNEKFELARIGSVGYRDSHKSLVQELTRLLEHPTVEQIDLRHTSLTDDDLKIIAQMSNLKDLDIGNTMITAEGVRHLAKLERLGKLNLWHTKIKADGGMSALEKLPRLKSLELDETDIDDTALPVLARMRSLNYLELWHTDVTRDGVAKLQNMRPDIEIKSNPRR